MGKKCFEKNVSALSCNSENGSMGTGLDGGRGINIVRSYTVL